jgi:hypothetical protein
MHVFHGITLDYVVLRGDMTNKKRKGRRTLRVLLKNDANGSPAAATIENKTSVLDEVSINLKAARSMWGPLPRLIVKNLQELTKRHRLSVKAGDVSLLGSQFYITHSGLLRIGERRRCSGIVTFVQKDLSDPTSARWVFRATVFKSPHSKGFVGYGDADPSNTSPLVRGAEMRVAETRAVNRALRKAYGIGLCSVEELGSFSAPQKPDAAAPSSIGHAGANGSSNTQPRLRDRLCLLIRQHNLDPALVKAYAADFCGTASLKDASRDLVQSFITQLAVSAEKDRDALVCKLNSYALPVEVKP